MLTRLGDISEISSNPAVHLPRYDFQYRAKTESGTMVHVAVNCTGLLVPDKYFGPDLGTM